jgi:protein TonB
MRPTSLIHAAAFCAVALAAALPAVAGAQDAPPKWIRKPSGDDLARAYPQKAASLGISGRGVIKCAITLKGDLTDCVVLEETPLGYGFGAAALSLAPKFRMQPAIKDGAPVPGVSVTIPLNFRMG